VGLGGDYTKGEATMSKPSTSKDGIFRDSQYWTESDWADLLRAYITARKKIAKRHRERANPPTVASSPAAEVERVFGD
jgi:hypothetical protein